MLDNQNNPAAFAGISIQINDPQSKPIDVHYVTSDQSGAYSESFVLPASSVQGQYAVYVSASKPGFNTAQAQTQFSVVTQATTQSSSSTSSSTSTSTLQTTSRPPGSPCFIATATYGSELTPEVTLLRTFRDLDVLRTSAGRNFMVAFNAFYYSFSPQVAAFIIAHDALRDTMKVVLYPLIGILYVTKEIFQSFSFNTELAVTLSGIFAATGIGLVYLGPVTTLCWYYRRPVNTKLSKIAVAAFLSGASLLGLVILGELIRLDWLLIVATGGTVLSFLALGGLAVPYILAHRSR